MSIKAAEYMVNNPKSSIIIVSLTEDQAKLIIVMILDYLEKHYKSQIAKGKKKPTQNRVALKNGSSSLARPVGNTGDAVRGFTGDVLIIDEASRMNEFVWSASRPTLLTTGGEIWLCSTPFGKQGYFWEAFQNKNERFTIFHISSEQVIQDRPISKGWSERQREEGLAFIAREREDMGKLQFGQEYLGLFLDELRQYFSDELIEKCCVAKRPENIDPHGKYYMGCDIARMGDDEGTYEIIKKKDKTNLVHVENQISKKYLTTQTEDRIRMLDGQYNCKKIYLDAGAGTLGVSIYDHLLQDTKLKRKIEAINNRARSLNRDGTSKQRLLKEDLYDNLRSLMEKGYIQLLDDEEVKLSLRSVQYEFMEKKAALTQMRIFGDYTHVVEGLIRAAWCAKEKDLNLWVRSIRV